MRCGYAFSVLILNFVSTLHLMTQWSEYLVIDLILRNT